jgi:uncharacterized protein YceH (UPF0502 family)
MPAIQLEPLEARVLGVLIEKELTTPDSYPLSLNALVNGCNQKNNRDPLLSVGEREVNDVILKLRVAGLAEFVQLAGARVEKYRHKAGAALHLEPAEVAVLAELLLRGAQQPGELRSRVERMHPLPTLEGLQAVLDGLVGKGLVVQLARRDGERTARWAQLLAPEQHAPAARPTFAASVAPAPAAVHSPAHAALEARVARLEADVARLLARLDAPSPRPDSGRPPTA